MIYADLIQSWSINWIPQKCFVMSRSVMTLRKIFEMALYGNRSASWSLEWWSAQVPHSSIKCITDCVNILCWPRGKKTMPLSPVQESSWRAIIHTDDFLPWEMRYVKSWLTVLPHKCLDDSTARHFQYLRMFITRPTSILSARTSSWQELL